MAVDYGILSQFKTVGDYDSARRAQNLEVQQAMLNNQLVAAKMQSMARGTDLPAPLQLANEYERALASGDNGRANNLIMFSKALDKGIFPTGGFTAPQPPTQGFPSPAPSPSPAPKLGEVLIGDPFKKGLTAPTRTAGSLDDLVANEQQRAGGVTVIPGYDAALANRGAGIKGAESQAQKDVELRMNPLITKGNETAKNEATADALQQKKGVQAENMVQLADEAKQLLSVASSGRLGNLIAASKGLVGASDESTQANARLNVIAAGLTSNVPRMEGPQSDRDVVMYAKAAADVGNINIPAGDRAAALQTVIDLQQKYLKQSNSDSAAPAPKPTSPLTGAALQVTIFNAKKAIRSGKNPEAVKKKLMDAGIDPAQAGL